MAITNEVDLTHIVRTTEQWENTYDRNVIIPEGVLCIEFTPSGKTNIKIGDGHHIFSRLPYVNGSSEIIDCYTKQETDNRIIQILNNECVVRIKGILDDASKLPVHAACGDLWFVIRQNPEQGNKFEEYLYSSEHHWELIGGTPVDIDLSKYATKEYVDSKLIDIENKLHTHDNKSILDQITAAFTKEEKEKLKNLYNYDDTELRELIAKSLHTHSNKEVLDAITKYDIDKLRTLENYDDTLLKKKITALEALAHEHSNKSILDKTTASFTTDYERLMSLIRLYIGATGFEDGAAGLVPPAKAGEQNYILTGSGKWVPNTGSGGTYELPIASDTELGGVIIGDGIKIDENGVISVEASAVIDLKPGNGLEIVDIPDETGYNLPDGYGKISYVESLQDQYTIIDYIPKETTRVVVEYSYEAITGGDQSLFGSRTGSTSGSRQFVLWMEWDSSGPYTGFIYGGNQWNGTDVPSNGYPLTCELGQKLTADVSVNGYYIDGTLIHSVTNTGLPSPYNLAIFHIADSNATVESNKTSFKGRIYSFKIYEGDMLVVDLIPTVIVSTADAGFYDVINNKFYQSKTTNSFTYDASSVIVASGGKQINLLPATNTEIGGVIIGKGINVDKKGVISVDEFQLEPATADKLGGVKIGEGLTITEDGTISATASTVYNAGKGISITKGSRKIPAEYQEIEYIESSGNAIFDTGYLVNPATVIDMDCIVYESSKSDWQFLYGSRTSTYDTTTIIGLVVRHYQKGYIPELWIQDEQLGTSSTFPYDERTILKQNMNELTWYPVSTGVSVTITGTRNLPTSSTTFAVSGFKDGSVYTFGPKCRIYSLKISDVNGITRDYVPCYRISDGVVGLYDLINDTFRYSATSTAFISGPVVSNSDGDSTNEDDSLYINNTGLLDAKLKEDSPGVIIVSKADETKELDVFQYISELEVYCVEDNI